MNDSMNDYNQFCDEQVNQQNYSAMTGVFCQKNPSNGPVRSLQQKEFRVK